MSDFSDEDEDASGHKVQTDLMRNLIRYKAQHGDQDDIPPGASPSQQRRMKRSISDDRRSAEGSQMTLTSRDPTLNPIDEHAPLVTEPSSRITTPGPSSLVTSELPSSVGTDERLEAEKNGVDKDATLTRGTRMSSRDSYEGKSDETPGGTSEPHSADGELDLTQTQDGSTDQQPSEDIMDGKSEGKSKYTKGHVKPAKGKAMSKTTGLINGDDK